MNFIWPSLSHLTPHRCAYFPSRHFPFHHCIFHPIPAHLNSHPIAVCLEPPPPMLVQVQNDCAFSLCLCRICTLKTLQSLFLLAQQLSDAVPNLFRSVAVHFINRSRTHPEVNTHANVELLAILNRTWCMRGIRLGNLAAWLENLHFVAMRRNLNHFLREEELGHAN